MALLIYNVTIYSNNDSNELWNNHALLIEGNRIKTIGPEKQLLSLHPNADKLDGGGRLLMPGFTNAHMHFYGTYARGMPLTAVSSNFHEILINLWWALDKVLDLDAVYYSALLPAITGIKKGVTSVIDHHASPYAVDGSLDRIEDALSRVGVRGNLCYEVSDRDGKAIRDQGFAENERYIKKCLAAKQSNPDHPFDALIGLHASFTLDDDSLEMAADARRRLGRGVHIHMLEDKVDETLTQEKYGRGVVERLAHFGLLGSNSIVAHGIFLDQLGLDLLKANETVVVHQAQSNMNNAVGRADVFRMLENGIRVGLGTDGMTPDVRKEVHTGFLMHKHHLSDCNAGWMQFEQMAMKNNPAIYQQMSGQQVGRIEPGWLADIILIDYDPPTPLTGDNFWGHFLFGLVDADVNTTIIDGKIVMHNKEIIGVDEAQISAESQKVAERVWKAYANQ